MKKIALHWQVLIALVLGVAFAWLTIRFGWNKFTLYYIKPFGDIFINALKLIAVPLVLFSIITGVASLKDIRKLGSMGVKTLAAYVITTMVAVLLGLLLVNSFNPGGNQDSDVIKRNRISYELWRDANGIDRLDEGKDIAHLPENALIVAEISGEDPEAKQNDWVDDKMKKYAAEKKKKEKYGPLLPLVDVVPNNVFKALTSMSMLQIIFFAIFFGVALVMLKPEHRDPVLGVVTGLNEVFIRMILIVMKGIPFFVFALMAGKIVEVAGGSLEQLYGYLSFFLWYGLVVILGLVILAFVFYPSLIQVMVRKIGFLKFIKGMKLAQITAFSTSSSLATLPVTMDCVNHNLGVSERTTSFVLPIGATINMDGTSFYQAVAVVALAQFHGIDLTLAQQAIIIVTATMASIGAAAIPSAGLVLMILVLESVGLNPLWIAIIFPIDRILDMCRTVVNVTGDGAVSTIIANSEGELNTEVT